MIELTSQPMVRKHLQLMRRAVGRHATACVKRAPAVLSVGLAFGLLGCSDPFEDFLCTMSIEPAIVVLVHDSVTGEPAALGARGVVRDGSYEDSLRISTWASSDSTTADGMSAANERPGSYDIHLVKSGYQEWRATDVVVGSGICHVATVTLQALLAPTQ